MKERIKQHLPRCLRAAGLLPAADRLIYMARCVRTCRDNRIFQAAHPDFACPPLALCFDAYNHVSYREYHDSGEMHARFLTELMVEGANGELRRICEWGCGPARVLRHMPASFPSDDIELFGTDTNEDSIAWCREHIPGPEFYSNGLSPPLPLDDHSADGIYALSIFTHLPAARFDEWLKELQRVVRPGGLILFTTHGANYRHQLVAGEAEAFDAGHVVERTQIQEGKKCFAAYHPESYVRAHLPEGLHIHRHLEGALECGLLQDIWVLAKRGRT